MNELFLDPYGENDGAQKIEVWNGASGDFDVGGYTLRGCGTELSFADGTVVAAGGFLVVHVGLSGANDAGNIFAPAMNTLDAISGEMALVAPDGVIGDYVQWGEAGQSLEGYAAAEGQWVAGEVCVKPVEGTSLSYVGSGSHATDYTARYPTIGSPN
ncbi:MAG: hypothetical protein HUU29_12675 [Planctomycetaceae bacterium]|nr:hypothetical protein [Planctomycetaceae bacterium]